MNVVANSVGVQRGRPEGLLGQLLRDYLAQQSAPLGDVERHVVCLRADDGKSGVTTKYGFLFGTGVVYGFLSEYYADGPPNPLIAARTLARAVGSTMVQGPMIRRMAEPFHGSVELGDGTHWAQRDYLAIAGGTIDQIGLSFKPFYRSSERPGAFHLLGIHTSPLGFVSQMGRIWKGRAMDPEHTHDAVVERAIIRSPKQPLKYMVDGDLHECNGPLEVSIGPVVRIVVAPIA
ncbi:MAG: sphingosine kinase, partial [Polyangiales bacterium]